MRNFTQVAEEIIDILEKECDFNEDRLIYLITQIRNIEEAFQSPDPFVGGDSWDRLGALLSRNIVPSNSRWETKIMMVYNDLEGSVDDYYDPIGTTMKDKMLFLCKHYGVRHQIKRVQSELFELNEAIINYENAKDSIYTQDFDSLREHVAEEFGDVLVMLTQIVFSYDITEEEIKDNMMKKINRQIERVKNGEIDTV